METMRRLNWKPLIGVTALALWLQVAAVGQWREMNPVTGVQQQKDGLLLTMKTGATRVRVCTDSIIRVTYAPTSSFPKREDYVVIKSDWTPPEFKLTSTDKEVTLTTAKLKLVVDKHDGSFVYSDASGRRLYTEQ